MNNPAVRRNSTRANTEPIEFLSRSSSPSHANNDPDQSATMTQASKSGSPKITAKTKTQL